MREKKIGKDNDAKDMYDKKKSLHKCCLLIAMSLRFAKCFRAFTVVFCDQNAFPH